jgi:hypothetical protein
MQVIVQTNNAARLSIAAVALQHFAPKWKPFATISLDEDAARVAVHLWLNDLHAFNHS